MGKILIQGESAIVREYIAQELAAEGHIVVAIGNSALIGELLDTLEPDLVLLDSHTWRLDGWEVLEGIKRRAPQLPVLTFTSYGGTKEEIRLEMMNRYGITRFSLEILKQKIAELPRKPLLPNFVRMRDDILFSRNSPWRSNRSNLS